MIRKIRDFIIGFRFKKYKSFLCKLYHILENDKQNKILLTRQFIKQTAVYMAQAMGAIQIRQIQLQPVKTKEEKQKKAFAIAQTIIDIQLATIKAYNIL